MKKIILTALIAVSSLAANAQVFLGGSLGIGLNKPGEGADTKAAITVAPTIGYNFNDQWALVVDLGDSYNGATEKNTFVLGAAARWSFAKAGIVTFFVDGGFAYATTNKGGDNTLSIGFTPGLKLAATKNIDFITTVGFLGYTSTLNNAKGNSFGLNASTNALSFGMLYNF